MKKKKSVLNKKENFYGYIMILPAMFFFTLFLLFPVLKAFQISMYDYTGIGKMEDFIGFGNYIKSFGDMDFYASILNTLKLMVFDMGITLPIAFVLAYLLYKHIPGWKVFSVTLFIPHIIPIIVSALVWRFMYEPNFGLINNILGVFGLDFLQNNWLGTYDTAFGSAVTVWIWKSIPFPMLVFYGAMLRIPEDLFEAAKIDGATEWQAFKSVLVPLMIPVISILLVLTIANNFRNFGMFWVLTKGGPGNATTISTIYVFKQAFSINKYGYANALAVQVVIIVGGIVTLFMSVLQGNKFGKKGKV